MKKKYHSSPVLAVDKNYQPMSEVSRRHGIKAVIQGRAQILDPKTFTRLEDPKAVFSPFSVIIYPYVTAVSEVKLVTGQGSKGILRRDEYTCQYCGDPGNTIDHITPVCQGGKSIWMNLVCACRACNQKKGGRTPEQAGMVLLRKIVSPRFMLFQRFEKLTTGKVTTLS